ncbi:MAG: head-tail connector protein [Clostridiales bacterium]|nr:head-tail connector protein [Clostridiales bacterium]
MALVYLDEAKTYLRVDSSDDDGLINILLHSACKLCCDVARLTDEQWAAVNGCLEDTSEVYTDEQLALVRDIMRVAILYALGYLYEHREEADHHGLTITLRSLLFSIREGVC